MMYFGNSACCIAFFRHFDFDQKNRQSKMSVLLVLAVDLEWDRLRAGDAVTRGYRVALL
jgi:hypothetical protein